jgi:deoxyribodipyrimidine photo-lyase
MKETVPYTIFWFRRDLRLEDNKGLFNALKNNANVIPLYIINEDDDIMRNDLRKHFVLKSLQNIHQQLKKISRGLMITKGEPLQIVKKLISTYPIKAIYFNKDHEPNGIQRDDQIKSYLMSNNIKVYDYLDHLIMDKNEILKDNGTPYTIFTPYKNKFRQLITPSHFNYYPSEDHLENIARVKSFNFTEFNFDLPESELFYPNIEIPVNVIENYHKTRDFPAKNGTSRLGLHIRYGTLSIRNLAKIALKVNEVYFNELLWREFFAMILWHFPYITERSFKSKYDNIHWLNNEVAFNDWKEGKTGYPMVDAGMRELIHTGYMHNRVRMIAASFLTKHLLTDWRWGEAWFAQHLLDYELSSNNGGWQWAAGSGCDAAPYFRIFNPVQQQKKFDPQMLYIKKWIPEIDTPHYPQPIINLNYGRQRCLETYKSALNT